MASFNTFGTISNNRQVKAVIWLAAAIGIIWVLSRWIIAGTTNNFILAGLAIGLLTITIRILNNWRDGFYMFYVWLLFEDLIRKYMGNNMVIFFAKDVLVAITFVSFVVAVRRHTARSFRPPFLFAMSLLFWLCVAQVFNSNSPSVLYGLLGLKMYFYYALLMFVGYALIQNENDLLRLLVLNLALAGLIALLGIIQAIVGLTFLNPQTSGSDILLLSHLVRQAPISGAIVARPCSVFVSDGRFAAYMVLMFIIGVGAAGYQLMRTKRGRWVVFPVIALTAVAGVMSGSRGAFLYIGASALILTAGMLWGWPSRQSLLLVRVIRRSVVMIAFGLIFLIVMFPKEINARFSLYSETLSPGSAAFELGYRAWDYPVHNLMLTFNYPNWFWGYGIGTASIGVQYVSALLGNPPPAIGVESGFGTLILELGILGPVLWLIFAAALLGSGWKILHQLKEKPLFPIALSIVYFAFLLLLPDTFGGLAPFENYINNAYFWLLIGILFKLPTIASQPSSSTPPIDFPTCA